MVFCDFFCDTNECSTNLIYASDYTIAYYLKRENKLLPAFFLWKFDKKDLKILWIKLVYNNKLFILFNKFLMAAHVLS